MNWDRIEGNWKQYKGKVKERWGKLSDDQLDVIAGKRDQLEGKLQEAYGVSRDQARKDVDEFCSSQASARGASGERPQIVSSNFRPALHLERWLHQFARRARLVTTRAISLQHPE